jgi:hypothetical protein
LEKVLRLHGGGIPNSAVNSAARLDIATFRGANQAMKLNKYMKIHALDNAQMAEKLACSPFAVRKWRYGGRMPRPDQMVRIADVTGGAVMPNDFYLPDGWQPGAPQ